MDTGGGGGSGYAGSIKFASSGIEGTQGKIFDYLLARGVPAAGISAILGNLEAQVNRGDTTWEDLLAIFPSIWQQILDEEPTLRDAILNAKDEEAMELAATLYAKFQEGYIGNNLDELKEQLKEQIENANKWYNEFKEKNPASVIGDGSNVLLYCELVAQEMLRNGVVYNNKHGLEYIDLEKNADYFTMKGQDCGGYVASVLYRAGVLTQEDANSIGQSWAFHHPKNFINALQHLGWDINIQPSEIQPGDIVSSGGHIVIYAGNNEFWDVYAGDTSSRWQGGTRNTFSSFVANATDLRITRPPDDWHK